MRCRRNATSLSPDERHRLVAGLNDLKARGIVDQYANDHAAAFNSAHFGSSFFPWHREFLRRFEDQLRTFDARITIPYWDFTVDNTTASSLWDANFMGGFDTAWSLGRSRSGPLPSVAEVQDAVRNSATFTPFLEVVETVGTIHDYPHMWVGGVMGGAASPGDPVFYLHHCFIDAMWAQWQALHSGLAPGDAYVPSGGLAGGGLNDPMLPLFGATTPADLLDHRPINAYSYPATWMPDTTVVTPPTGSITFNDVPAGETVMRAAVFALDSCDAVTLQATPPVVTSGPAGTSFGLLAATSTTDPAVDPDGRIWVSFKGTAQGDVATGKVTIAAVGTGHQWTVPITANTIRRPTAAVVMALDQSNSMNFDSGIGAGITRGAVLRFSAPPFGDVLYDDDAVAVFTFDQDPHPGLGVTPVAGLGRAQVRAAIAAYAPNPNGWTAIGEAVAFADGLLQPVTGYDKKAIVVLTDGEENHGPFSRRFIADVAGTIAADQVYAIGLGSAQNINPAALQALCNGHNGALLLTGDLTPDAYFRLAKYYQQILVGVINNDIVLDPEGWIAPGEQVRIPFMLNETDIEAKAILLTPAPLVLRYTIETPAGDVIDPPLATTDPQMAFVVGNSVAYYRTELPLMIGGNEAQAGMWTAVLGVQERTSGRLFASLEAQPSAAATKAHGLRYNFLVQSYSNLRLRARLAQDSLEPGATLTLRAVLTEYGLPVAGRAAVRAELTRPDDTQAVLALAETEPGVFETSLKASLAGIWRFRVLAAGRTMRGRPFTREQTLTGAVWQGGNRPPPTGTGTGTGGGTGGSGGQICRLLECLLKQEGILRWLKQAGIDVGALEACLREICAEAGSEPPGCGTLQSGLRRILKDETMLRAAMGELQRAGVVGS